METLKLKAPFNNRLKYGHWWIFSNELEKIRTDINPGEICRFEYSNGAPCGVGFFNPHSLISGRLLVKNSYSLDDNFVKDRIAAAFEHRKALGLDKYCRIFFGESDFIGGLVIDRYGDIFCVQIISAGAELLSAKISQALYELFSPKAIIIKRDHQYRHLEGIEKKEDEILGKLPKKIIIEENGCKYEVDLALGQKTGWYFDQRENRAFLIPFFEGKKVLDLYCYTGAFSVLAAKNGAEIVWGADSSEKAVELAQKNAQLNKIKEDKIIFQKCDAEKMLDALEKGELPEKPDFILLDPPNFIRSKKNSPQAEKLYAKLLSKVLRALPSGGYAAFSTCSQHISPFTFEDIIKNAAMISSRKTFLLEHRYQSKDHPILAGMEETRYLNFALLRVK
ncbi:MAG: class I SAM-dependent rRNA methyltransferase [Elusimicrobia bacterium]|nr:class I SAM-dependent rRNA methyltransferase [Elusimicrobiota bacterium]